MLEQIIQQAQAFFSQNLTPYLYNIAIALLIFFVGKILVKYISRLLEAAMEKHLDPIVARFLANILHIVLFAIVLIAALSQLGLKTTSLVAVLGAISLAIGLSLKDSLANFAAGVLLIVLRPFRVGDYVEVAGIAGTAKEIKIFATTLVTTDNKVIFVPNSGILASNITNYSAMPTRRVDLTVRIPYDADLKQIKSALSAMVAQDQRILKDPEVSIGVSQLADTGVDIFIRPWAKNSDYWAVRGDLIEKIKQYFSDINLNLPAQRFEVRLDKTQ